MKPAWFSFIDKALPIFFPSTAKNLQDLSVYG